MADCKHLLHATNSNLELTNLTVSFLDVCTKNYLKLYEPIYMIELIINFNVINFV